MIEKPLAQILEEATDEQIIKALGGRRIAAILRELPDSFITDAMENLFKLFEKDDAYFWILAFLERIERCPSENDLKKILKMVVSATPSAWGKRLGELGKDL